MKSVLLLATFVAISAHAAPTHHLVIEGFLKAPDGTALNDGKYPITFSLYAAKADDVPLWTEDTPDVGVAKGYFQARLGAVTPLSVALFASAGELWLGTKVSGKELPRTPIETDPYAFRALSAADADTVGGIPVSSLLVLDVDGKVPLQSLPAIPTYTAGNGLVLVGAAFSINDDYVKALAKSVAYDTPAELVAAVPGWDQDASDDLTAATTFEGDVTGTYQSLKLAQTYAGAEIPGGASKDLACTACVGFDELAPDVAQKLADFGAPTLDKVSNGTLTNTFALGPFINSSAITIENSTVGQTSTVTVPEDSGSALAVSVAVDITHGDVSELVLKLTSPSGKTAVLANHDLSGANTQAEFASNQPPLDGMLGLDASGTWTLTVLDDTLTVVPEGKLNQWSLKVTALSAKRVAANGTLDMQDHFISGLKSPAGASDAATKAYVDGIVGASLVLTQFDQSVSSDPCKFTNIGVHALCALTSVKHGATNVTCQVAPSGDHWVLGACGASTQCHAFCLDIK